MNWIEPQVPIEKIKLNLFEEKGVEVYIKREDLIHKYISGNKYRKLKYNILEAQKKYKSLLTFGGAYSNHILAVAYVGKEFGLKTIGIIRGDELAKKPIKELRLNPTLSQAMDCGMQFKFVSREIYRNKENINFIQQLKQEFRGFYLIPEGGTNHLAIKGCKEILNTDTRTYNIICCAIGTGGTISGIINASEKHQKIIGFAVLKNGNNFLTKEIQTYTNSNKWKINNNYHFGGYAKYTDELIHFINNIKQKTKLSLCPIYTGKMFYGIYDMITKNEFTKGTKILLIHTGGLQGIVGINQLLELKNKTKIIF